MERPVAALTATTVLEEAPCSRCGATGPRAMFVGRDYLYGTPYEARVAECRSCGLWFQHPRPPLARHGELYPATYVPHAAAGAAARQLPAVVRSYLARRRGYGHLGGAQGRNPLTSARDLALDPLLRWWTGVLLIPEYVSGGRVLEVGCGHGGMLRTLAALGWRDLHGIEPDAEAAGIASRSGAEVRVGAVEDMLPMLPDSHFNAAIASMVVEHLADPYAVVRDIARKLRPGGELLLSTVSRDSPDAALFREHWAGFDFPRHMTYFRDVDIAALFERDFEGVERFAQVAPIDWVRSASWRGRSLDRVLAALGPRGWLAPSVAFAAVGRATRVSLRARRRS